MNGTPHLLATVAALFAAPAMALTPSARAPGYGPTPELPAPDPGHKVANFSTQKGWAPGETPTAPKGFTVTRLAEGLDSPRWIHVLPNGDILVAEARTKPSEPENEEERRKAELQRQAGTLAGPSANRITLLRDVGGDGIVDIRTTFLEGLNQPFGMALLDDRLYVANTDGILRFPYEEGQTGILAAGEKILDLPAGGYNNHWTRNLLASPDGSKLYVTVGSASNNAEYGLQEEIRRANILEIDPDGGNERIYAGGLRNPNGMAWEPATGSLWTAVNERDNIGDDLVPDYLTSVREGGFYGWPFSYFGQHPDPRMEGQRPDLVEAAIVPDFALGSHTASLGLAFYTASAFPQEWRGGAFIGQRGSWNRSEFSGYKVVYVPFADGRPEGGVRDFLTGFMADPATGETRGRPVGVAVDAAGALLVADDTGGIVWRVSAD
jgi:glucose/arabinose dehydrogenase